MEGEAAEVLGKGGGRERGEKELSGMTPCQVRLGNTTRFRGEA